MEDNYLMQAGYSFRCSVGGRDGRKTSRSSDDFGSLRSHGALCDPSGQIIEVEVVFFR